MDSKLLIALVAAGASVVAALVSLSGVALTVIYGRHTQTQVEALKAKLATRKSSQDARRDYTYDARRRLYTDCEPSIFLLLDAADTAHQRVGRLFAASPAQLIPDDVRLATLYRLLLPAVVFAHPRERLTLFDLSIDPRVHLQYELGRLIAASWSDDHTLAAMDAEPLLYRPRESPPDGEDAHPRVYAQQGVSVEHLEAFASALRRPSDSGLSFLSFAEFARLRQDKQHGLHKATLDLDYLLRNFTPATRPVLSRVLHAQTLLFELTARTRLYDDVDWAGTLSMTPGHL